VIHYADDWLTVYQGDCREVMAGMEPESVHCVVTSPPYWGLRDYGTATWIGGNADHEHVGQDLRTADTGGPKQQTKRGSIGVRSGDCLCGAVREDGQLGLEATPELYVAAMVEVFREVRRVLRADGTVWLNLGDSYAAGGTGGASSASTLASEVRARSVTKMQRMQADATSRSAPPGLKPKDLVGIPWRVAFALQADGWYLRSDIIWAKPNPMPESVTDRPTKAHEYLFLLSKSARYYFDGEAVRLPISQYNDGRISVAPHDGNSGRVLSEGHRKNEWREYDEIKGANIRTVWTIATQPYPGAHFATFPEALVEPCVKAGSPEGGTVLDPFGGSGTTARVANRLSRRAILIDLSTDYLDQAMVRNAQKVIGL